MTRLLAVAAVLLASSAAHAQYTFHYSGRTIRIDPNSGAVSIRRSPGHIHRPAERAALRSAPPTLPPTSVPTRSLQRAVMPKPGPEPAVAVVAPRAPSPTLPVAAAAAPASAAARHSNSPIGLWLTQEKAGKVRIEQCGASLCGYSVDLKSNQDGEQVLIDMKPGNGLVWRGRILDPNTGSTYDSTIALKSADRLRVQGCAFNGMFCGGQTWTRAN